jgi:hypothetical protein
VCTSGLLFNGDVGVGGICDWAAVVDCPTDDSGIAVVDVDADADTDVIASATTTTGATETTTIATKQVLPSLMSQSSGISSNNNGDDDNPESYFCGESETDAAVLCKPCPSGRMIECSDNFTHGCFRGITSCSSSRSESAEASTSTSASASTGTFADAVNDALSENLDGIVNSYHEQVDHEQVEAEAESDDDDDDGDDVEAGLGSTPSIRATPIPSLSPTLPPYTMAPFAPSQSSESKTVIGYYASWQWYDRNKLADPINIDFTKYTRINFAFFQPDITGNLYGTDEWADPQLLFGPYLHDTSLHTDDNRRCSWDKPMVTTCNHHDTMKGLLYLAQSRGVEVWPSIGGWTLSDNFPTIAADAELRENFAQQCVDLIRAYGFDGECLLRACSRKRERIERREKGIV